MPIHREGAARAAARAAAARAAAATAAAATAAAARAAAATAAAATAAAARAAAARLEGPKAEALAVVAPDSRTARHPGRFRFLFYHCPCSEYNRMVHLCFSCRIDDTSPAKIVLNLCKNSR